MAESFNSIAPGEVIDGKYTIGHVIGSGGMGTVYEAVQRDLDRRVALKILHSKYSKSRKIVERFHQEARLAGSIEHDNICRVTDHGTSRDGAPYLVMPLLTGRSLAKILESGESLSVMRTIDIVCQTLQALAAAHAEKIVHRDLKPDNIFVTQVGDREDFVKLLDFGISKVLEKDSVSDLTSTGMVLGTAYYLAPEQARGSKRIDHRVDIYAMGVILYEALTGLRPFEGDTYNEVVFKIAGDPVRSPRAINPRISRAVEKVILKAMAIDPNARFSSAIEMCEALEQAAVVDATDEPPLIETLGDTEVEGRPSVYLTDADGRKRRNTRVWLAGGLAIGIVLVGIVGLMLWGLRSGEDDNRARESTVLSTVHIGDTVTVGGDTASDTMASMGGESSEDAPLEDAPPDTGAAPILKTEDESNAEKSVVDNESSPSESDSVKTDLDPEASSAKNSEKKKHRGLRRTDSPKAKQKDEPYITGPFNTKFVFE